MGLVIAKATVGSRGLRVCAATWALRIATVFSLASTAHAETRLYVIAVGNNGLPVDSASRVRLQPLSFADDDAASFYSFASLLTENVALLTELDRNSQNRFPSLQPIARPPTAGELRKVIAQFKAAILEGNKRDEQAQVLFFFSGHGSRARSGKAAALALADGALTAKFLTDEIVTELPAQAIHLLIDACHAESIVESIGAKNEGVDAHVIDRTKYSRSSRVGVVIATHVGAQAHEWDVFKGGIFSHEIVSGLRGAADVNQDGAVEYGELQAFLQAANRSVSDPQIRLQTIVRAPANQVKVTLVDLNQAKGGGWLHGSFGKLGPTYVEDEAGNRLADIYAEFDATARLLLPTESTLYLRGEAQVARLRLENGQHVGVETLAFVRPLAAKGGLETAWDRGLFATAFGPLFFDRFLEQQLSIPAILAH